MSSKKGKRGRIVLGRFDMRLKEAIGQLLPQMAGNLLNRIAWAREDNKSYSDLDWNGKAKRTNGWMPVDTSRAIGSVFLLSTNAGQGLIIIGSNVEYMVYLEEGTRSTPAFAPFKNGSEYAFVHDIQPMLDDVLTNELDEQLEDMLDAIEFNFK